MGIARCVSSQEEKKMVTATRTVRSHTMTMEECVDKCTECREICLQTVAYCLEQGGGLASHPTIRLLTDCAEICGTSANFLVRGSPYHSLTCFVCGEICDTCAEYCERFADEAMRECAEACRACADYCRTMALESGISVEYADEDYGEAFEEIAEGARRQGTPGRRNNLSDS
jgi:hypothetical protein